MKPLGPGDPLRLGPYRLIGVLGAGGMGQVYLGRDSTGGTAAVKVLHPEYAHQQEMARRFVREAEAARTVRSTGVARVLAAQTEGGRPWIATEFLAGPTLDAAVERYGPFGGPALRALAAALARTLRDIHAAGLVHRDVKPSNIVLTSSGPRVIDFGIARPEHGLTLTSTGQVPVTPGYGAPEQVLGHRTGPPGDVFSLGAVLVHAASGQRAYEGGHVAAVQYEVVHGEPRLDGVPSDLRPLIAPCLARQPGDRPLPEEIERAMAPPRRADRVWREGPLAADIARREADARRLASFPTGQTEVSGPNRRRAMTLMAGGSTLALAALGTGAWWLWGPGGSDPERWKAGLLPESAADSGNAPEALWGPVTVAGDDTGDDWSATAPVPARELVLVTAGGRGLQAFDTGTGERRWAHPEARPGAGTLAPAPDLVLCADGGGRLIGLNHADGARRWTASVEAAVLLAADDEAVYVVTRGGRIRAVSIGNRKVRWTVKAPVPTSGKGGPVRAAAGQGRLVLSGTDGTVAALAAGTGEPAWGPREGQSSEALAPALADGSVYLGGKSLTALDLADGAVQWSHRPQHREAGPDGWSAPAVSGGRIYAVDGSHLTERRADDGSQSWTHSLGYDAPPADPPVVQGHTVWTVVDSTGGAGVAAVRSGNGSRAWLHGAGQDGAQRMAAEGNRVFILHNGTLTAMPVF